MTQTINVRWQMRRDTAANLASTNEVPLVGEWYYETDTNLGKVGDGTTHYNDLPYTTAGLYDPTGIADGDAMLWDAARGLFVPGTAGAAIEAGTGIEITEDSDGVKTISTSYGAISLSGRVATYADLPTGLGSGDAGEAYLVDADQLIYVWDGTAWPANGSGYSGNGGGDLKAAILADSPRAYYSFRQDTISGTSVTDLSGHGHTATLPTASPTFARLVPSDPNGLYPMLAGNATVSDNLGLTTPMNYSYSIAFLMNGRGASYGLGAMAGGCILLAFGLSGETSPANWSCVLPNTGATTNYFQWFWEYGSGSDSNSNFDLFSLNSGPVLIHCVKDSTNKKVSIYTNGRLLQVISYTNEPSGGTLGQFSFGGAGGPGGHWAYFDGVLSADRIYAHAKAAGLA